MPKLSRTSIFVIIGVVLIAAAFGVVFYFKSQVLQKTIDLYMGSGLEPLTATSQSALAISGVSDWKTYRNDAYGFEMKYPSFYTPKSRSETEPVSDGITVSFGTGSSVPLTLEVFDLTKYLPKTNTPLLSQYIATFKKLDSFKEAKVNGNPVYEYLSCGSAACEQVAIFIRNNIQYQFSIDDQVDPDLFGKILSTFKFIEPNLPVDTSSWKTYHSERYGFEFKYPVDWSTCTPDENMGGFNPEATGEESALILGGGQSCEIDMMDLEIKGFGTSGVWTDYYKPTNLDEYLKSFTLATSTRNIGYTYFQTSTIGGATAVWYKIRDAFGGTATAVYFEHNGNVYKFEKQDDNFQHILVYKPVDDTQLSQIFSTFKFIKSSSTVDTSSWKTYRNDEFGFSLTYAASQTQQTGTQSGPSLYFGDELGGTYDPVAAYEFNLSFSRNPDKFHANIYNVESQKQDDLTYAPAKKQWVVSSLNPSTAPCPSEMKTPNQGLVYYRIPQSFHAGSYVDTYVTTKGIIMITGGVYFADDKFHDDIITFDNPQDVLQVSCNVAR